MLARLVEFALIQRGFVLLATLVLAGLGWQAARQTPIDAFPDVSTTQVKVIVRAPGMTPEEVEARITAPIEVELLGIPEQRNLRSVTKYALADITLDFEEGTDVYWARQQVGERLQGLWGDLPEGVRGGVAPITTPLGEMFMFTLESDTLGLGERRTLLDWVIRPALRTVEGVADVNALGGRVETFEIVPRPAAVLARGISVAEIREAVEHNNSNDGAGRLVDGEEVLLVRSEGRIRTLADLQEIVVRSHPIEPVRLRDVADVQIGSLTRYGAVTQDGQGETVQGLVLGLRGANAREVVEGVRARLDDLAPTLPEDVEIRIFYDRGALVDRAIGTVGIALGSAIVLVIGVLVVFLANARAAVVASLVLPLSVLGTFVWMRAFDLSANLMSLGGLAIAIGMLVDSAVVVIENTTTLIGRPGGERVPTLHLVYRAVREVALPVTSGTAIIVLVFLPLLTLEGLEGKLFIPVALTIVFALVTALALSLTSLPVVASWVMKARPSVTPRFMLALERAYASVLEVCFARPQAVGAGMILLLLTTLFVFPRIGQVFLPDMDEGNVIVQLEQLPSIDLDKAVEQELRVERALIERVPEITGVVARTGADEIGLDPMGLNETDVFLVLRPREEWEVDSPDALHERIRAVFADFPGLIYGFTQPIDMRVSEMLTGVRGDVAVKVRGFDLEILGEATTRIAEVLRSIPGAADVIRSQVEGAEFLEIDVDREAVGRLGLSVDGLQTRLRARLEGLRVGLVYDGARRVPIVLRSDEASGTSAIDFVNLQLPDDQGESIPLDRLALLRRVEGPVQVNREAARRFAVVTVNVRGRDLVGFVEEARARLDEAISLPTGYQIEWGGQFENQQRASARLALVVPVSLALIFVLLFGTFRSTRQAALVLANIPLALIGGVFALWLTGEYLSVPATIGFIALLGIAVLNGVVLVSTFNQLRDAGHDLEEVVRSGSLRRLRPVLMTATSTALGLLPLLVSSGPGAELQRPLAIVVIGGLLSSTSLTLVLLPMLYRAMARREGVAVGEAIA
jgi:cobalt-zinc-cadmium resistance protein CzcA